MSHRGIFRERCAAIHISLIFSCLLLTVFLAGVAPTAGAQQTWNLKVGAESHDAARQADAFLPNEIWIYAGDSI